MSKRLLAALCALLILILAAGCGTKVPSSDRTQWYADELTLQLEGLDAATSCVWKAKVSDENVVQVALTPQGEYTDAVLTAVGEGDATVECNYVRGGISHIRKVFEVHVFANGVMYYAQKSGWEHGGTRAWIALQSQAASTGYVWHCDVSDDTVLTLRETGTQEGQSGRVEGEVPCTLDTFTFAGLKNGECFVTFTLQRGVEEPAETVRYRVTTGSGGSMIQIEVPRD